MDRPLPKGIKAVFVRYANEWKGWREKLMLNSENVWRGWMGYNKHMLNEL